MPKWHVLKHNRFLLITLQILLLKATSLLFLDIKYVMGLYVYMGVFNGSFLCCNFL